MAQEVRDLVGKNTWTRATNPRHRNDHDLDALHFKPKERNPDNFRRQSESRWNADPKEKSKVFGSQEIHDKANDGDDIFGLGGMSFNSESDDNKKLNQQIGFNRSTEKGQNQSKNDDIFGFEDLVANKEKKGLAKVKEALRNGSPSSGERDAFGDALGKLASHVKDESRPAFVKDSDNGININQTKDSTTVDSSLLETAALEATTNQTEENISGPSELSVDKNIFDTDVFNIPPPPPIREEQSEESPQTDNIALKVYWELLDLHTDPERNKKFIRPGKKNKMTEEEIAEAVAYLREPELAVELNYPLFDAVIASKDKGTYGRIAAKEEAETQAEVFLKEMNFDEKQQRMVQAALKHIGSVCAKNNTPEAFPILWQKAKEVGLVDEKFLVLLLHLGANLFLSKTRELEAKMKQSIGTPSVLDLLDKGSAILENQKRALEPSDYDEETYLIYDELEELFTFVTSHYNVNEQMVHTRMRLLIAQGRGKEAHALLNESESKSKLHLRSFTPVLGLFLDQNDMESALAIYNDMQRISTVYFDSDTYIQLLASLAENGYLNPGFQEAPSTYSGHVGPLLLDEIASVMSEDILQISLANAKRMHNGMAKGFESSGLQWISALETMKLDVEPDQGPVLASRVRIDHDAGFCHKSGIKLRLKKLTEDQCTTLIEGCKSLASSRQKEWHKIHSLGPIKERADDALADFLDWLDTRQGTPYTAVIDAANIGHHMQNYEGGKFSHAQIKFVVDELVAQGENPLVVMPHRYTRKYFNTPDNGRQFLTEMDFDILSEFHNADRLFVVPPGCKYRKIST